MSDTFTFNPVPRNEIQQNHVFTLLDPGFYPFEVVGAVSKFSSSGNPMLELSLYVNGHNHLKDWVVIHEKMMWKAAHFSDSIGVGKSFDKGNINIKSIIGKKGQLEIEVVPDKRHENAMQNKVKDYIPVEIQEEVKEFNDDIPF